MKTLFTLALFYISLLAQEHQLGKIDMHGGNYDDKYQKTTPKKDFACMADFLDKNSSKATKKTDNRLYK